MQKWNKNMCKFVGNEFTHQHKANKACNRVSHVAQKYTGFLKRGCSYFEPEVKNGGPNPDKTKTGMRYVPRKDVWVKRRNRRDLIENVFDDESSSGEFDDVECDGNETGFSAELCAELTDLPDSDNEDNQKSGDGPDGEHKSYPGITRKSGKKQKVKKVKWSPNEKKLRKGLLTFIKFCDRYLSECKFQRVGNMCQKRAERMWWRNQTKLKGFEGNKAHNL